MKQESFGQRLQLELRDINLNCGSDVESCEGCDLNHLTQLLQGGTKNRNIFNPDFSPLKILKRITDQMY